MPTNSARLFAARRDARGDELAAFFRHLAKALLAPYRPELHYMRGPGPKWRAKHGSRPTVSDAH